MASVTHLKGVRTRFRNIIEKNIQIYEDLTHIDIEIVGVDSSIAEANKCLQNLQLYNEKLERQSEKLAAALEESDPELVIQITEDDSTMCAKAVECCMDLKQLQEKFLCYKENKQAESIKSVTKEQLHNEELVKLQQNMQKLMEMQIEQQKRFMDSQEHKGKFSSMKLPKLDLISFGGDKTKWIEFRDSFMCSVHENKSLSNIEKFNYLKSKIYGDAQRAISGLALSDANYNVAINILKERFGNVQETVDLHYNKLINLTAATNKTNSLRNLLDTVEKHLRSLEVLNQNINQDVFVSMVRAKIPEDVLVQLEIQNGANNKWSITKVCDRLKDYVIARERSEKMTNESDKKPTHSTSQRTWMKPYDPKVPPARGFTSSAHALSAVRKQPAMKYQGENYADKCRYCQQKHWSDECTKYKTLNERKAQLKDSCYKCLKAGHHSSDCKRSKVCTHCGDVNAHHRSLCPKKFRRSETMAYLANEQTTESSEHPDRDESALVSSNDMVLMQTAIADIVNPETSENQSVRLILDSGSHRTYISEKLANKLHLKQDGEQEIKLVTFGSNTSQTIKTKYANINVILRNGEHMPICVNVVPTISGELHRRPVSALQTDHIKHIVGSVDLADTLPSENESSSIEMLIGNDYYLDFILSQKIELQPGLFLLGSKLGWILTGRTNDQERNTEPCMLTLTYGTSTHITNGLFTAVDSVVPTKPDLQDFWNVESIGILDKQSKCDDEIAMKMFEDTIQFEKERYNVRWPWIDDSPDLPANRELAVGRLRSCISKMKNKPELLQAYDQVIKDQLNKGMIEEVKQSKVDGLLHYLPHHAVITPQKTTTKLRIVYDASAKTKSNKCLNECLYRGPVMLQDLCGMLMRFRMQPIAIVSDIEKAFLQIGLQIDQRDVTRFVWIKDCDHPSLNEQNFQEYRFCRVPFGIVSSPFLLGATVDFHLKSYNDEVAEKLRNDIYVDNVITGAENVCEAIHIYQKAKTMFTEASMNLREWVTNSEVVNEFIPKEDRADTESVKVLGHYWDVKKDTISLKTPKFVVDSLNVTKRNVLKGIASVFDPLGLLSPVLLPGKVLLQSLWQKQLDWDDKISEEDLLEWERIASEINKIDSFPIPRCLHKQHGKQVEYKLLCFSDASEKAYSAVVYLYMSTEHTSSVDIVFSKTRLAPVKKLSIPKLELLAVLIGVRCLNFVRKQIAAPMKKMYLWTDSKCVLSWIASDKKLSVFVKNRVSEIKEQDDITFAYIASKENPADIASRGTTMEKLSTYKTWWYGPWWLLQPCSDWPMYSNQSNHSCEEEFQIAEEENKHETVLLQSENSKSEIDIVCSPPFGIDYNRYSSVTKLFRVTALVLRFIRKLKKDTDTSGPISNSDLLEAEKRWLRYVQKKHFQKEIAAILAKKTTNLQQQLGLSIDENGLLRCIGRFENSSLSEECRRPILLPRHEYFTKLVIEKCHKDLLHSGVSQTLAQTRYRFWIVHGRATVKAVLNKCTICRRHEGGCYKMPPMCPLPTSRVSEAVPFSRTGLDYFGPVYIKTAGQENKAWVCLFTCLVTRAVHLELVSDMTTEEFLLCLRRFIAQRGKPTEITSDNAKQFKAANSVLNRIWQGVLQSQEIQSYVANAGITWHFIVELAPWMGGFYERLVGLVKRSFRKTIGRILLTLIQLQTMIKEVEAVVNSRPLVYVGDDLHSTISLTPSHFLTLNPNTGIPHKVDENDTEYLPYVSTTDRLLSMWKKGQKLLDKFWQIWRNEYLASLRERTQTRLKANRIQSSVEVAVGNVVIVKENIPRGGWKLATVVQLIPSRDKEIRSCKIRLSNGNVLNRPLKLLYPIETTSASSADIASGEFTKQVPLTDSNITVSTGHVSVLNSKQELRKTRASASKALEAIKQQLSQ